MYETVKDFGAIRRGSYYLENCGFWGTLGLSGAATGADWAVTIATGGTPGAWILLGGVLIEAPDDFFFW